MNLNEFNNYDKEYKAYKDVADINMSNTCEPDSRIESDYLIREVMKPLSEAVADTLLLQPRDPISHIAHYLRFFNDRITNTLKVNVFLCIIM